MRLAAKIATEPLPTFICSQVFGAADGTIFIADLIRFWQIIIASARQQDAEDCGTNKINDLARDSLFHDIPPDMMEAPAGGGAVVRQHPLNLLRPCIEKPPWVVLPDSAIIPYTPLGAKGFR